MKRVLDFHHFGVLYRTPQQQGRVSLEPLDKEPDDVEMAQLDSEEKRIPKVTVELASVHFLQLFTELVVAVEPSDVD